MVCAALLHNIASYDMCNVTINHPQSGVNILIIKNFNVLLSDGGSSEALMTSN
jgi:hypothetical protein